MTNNQQKMFAAVQLHYELHSGEELSPKQIDDMHAELEQICGMFCDGYDRARALEILYYWGSIDADLVQILHGGEKC